MTGGKTAPGQVFSFERLAWLIVARGGWWRPQEVAVHMPADMDLDPRVMQGRLWLMAERNRSLVRREVPSEHKGRVRSEYAVTGACHTPRGLTVDEIVVAATGGKA